ncbi:hypothetical protein MRB53_020128 [Persea americana]|uniref:Uncharacterized protein n=1 Tax=Persea americana TaxID=3435 RepID=A0ACC2L0A5_PERAE|nr:hypothetical protein MRB53_020128 [Persea americana]
MRRNYVSKPKLKFARLYSVFRSENGCFGHLPSPSFTDYTTHIRFSPKFDLQKNHSHLLRLCAENQAILEGKSFHSRILKTIPQPHLFLSNSLANMYAKCGAMQDALQVFDEVHQLDVVSWNIMISGYFLSGSWVNGFSCFSEMLSCGVAPDQFSFTSVFKGCISFGWFGKGLQVHCSLIKFGLGGDAFVGSGLSKFYANFYCFDEAMKVFDDLVFKDVVLINTMIGIVARNGDLKEAFLYFGLILTSSLVPTRATFVNMLGAINGCERSRLGKQVHCAIIKYGLDDDGTVENSLVGMYATCNAVDDAFDLLVHSGSKNVMSWTTLITGYAGQGCFQDAMDVFSWFYHEAMATDSILLSSILTLSAASECFLLGIQIHCVTLKVGFESEKCIIDALMDMYAKCSSMDDVMKIFGQLNDRCDLFSWTTVISGYVHNRLPMEAVMNFYQMHIEGVNPDSVACISAIMGCIDLEAVDQGEQVHAYAIKSGCVIDISIQTALLSLYAEVGSLDSVLKLFGNMVRHDVVSWTALISVHARLGYNEAALFFLIKMLQEGAKPNHFTLASALTACSRRTVYETGKSLHTHVIKVGLEANKFVGCALIDMYANCGSMGNAVSHFLGSPKHDVVLWNSLLAGHAHHGNGLELLKAFDEMQIHGVNPDHVTFLTVLSGCGHSGLVDQVYRYFLLMHDEYGITPMKEHYACVADALVRAGLFKEAVEFIDGMGFDPGIMVLRSLLSSCIIHEHIKLGFAAVAKMMLLGENDAATYVLLSNLYAVDGRWDEAKKVREVMERKPLKEKKVGKSWIESKA